MRLLAIDPGPSRSAWVDYDGHAVAASATVGNEVLLAVLRAPGSAWEREFDVVVIEKVESFGMAVGAEVFETVFWSGRFAEAVWPKHVERIGRRAVKVHLCERASARDANVRQALLDRFGGKGTKAAPGPLYGISGDAWSALAVAVTWADQNGVSA